MYIYIYVYTHTYIYAYIYTYKHVFTYINSTVLTRTASLYSANDLDSGARWLKAATTENYDYNMGMRQISDTMAEMRGGGAADDDGVCVYTLYTYMLYVYTHIRMYIDVCPSYTYMHINLYTYLCTYIHVSVYTYKYDYMYLYTYFVPFSVSLSLLSRCTCKYLSNHASMYAFIHARTYPHTRTCLISIIGSSNP